MAAKFYTGVDLCNQELLRARLQLLSASPTVYAEGMIYYDNSTANNTAKRAVIRTNSGWKGLAYVSDLDAYVSLTTFNTLSSKVTGIDNRLKSVETIFETDNDGTINKWNEVVAFLAGIDGDTLDSMLDAFALKATSITAGAGLSGTIKLDGTGTFALATSGVTAGTYPKVTVDKYGRVTAGASLAEGDIPALPISKITNLQTTLGGLDERLSTIEEWFGSVGKFFKYNSTEKAWYLDGDFYTTGQNAAGEAGSASDGSGSGIILNYDAIVEALGYTPAKSTDLSGLTSRVSALESKATSVSYAASTASSAVIGTLTIDGKANDVTLRSANVTSALGYTPTRKFTGTISTTGGTTQTFTHNFNTRDVIVQIFMPNTPWEQVYADVRVSTVNSVAIAFAEAPTMAYKVVIIG